MAQESVWASVRGHEARNMVEQNRMTNRRNSRTVDEKYHHLGQLSRNLIFSIVIEGR